MANFSNWTNNMIIGYIIVYTITYEDKNLQSNQKYILNNKIYRSKEMAEHALSQTPYKGIKGYNYYNFTILPINKFI